MTMPMSAHKSWVVNGNREIMCDFGPCPLVSLSERGLLRGYGYLAQ